MLSLFLLSLVAATTAQNYTLPEGFDINKIELGTRSSWCTSERSQCPKICGGVADENSCEPQTLDFSCKCENGTEADVEPYLQTVPYFVCEANFGQCIAAHPDDADGQEKCKDDNKCGSLNATEDATSPSSSSSSSPSPTAVVSMTSMPSSTDAASTDDSSSPSSTNAAGSLRALAQEHSTGVLATALLAAMRLVL